MDTVSQKPAPRAAVKVREATAQRLDLDGEHGDGMAPSSSGRRLRAFYFAKTFSGHSSFSGAFCRVVESDARGEMKRP